MDVLVLSGAAGDFAHREADNGRESVFILEWRLPLIGRSRGHRDGSAVEGVEIAFMPGSIAKWIGWARAISGNGGYERHGNLADYLPGTVLFLADHDGRVIWVADTSAEIED